MIKSDIIKKYDPEIVRFFMLSSHYRNPINFSEVLMEQSKSAVERVYTCIDNLHFLLDNSEERDLNDREKEYSQKLDEYKQKFIDAMDDDLNTADAIAAVFDIVYASNTYLSTDTKNAHSIIDKALSTIKELGDVLGLFNKNKNNSLNTEIEAMIEERNRARKDKNWAKADEIRDRLKEMHIILKDTPMGVKWSYEE